MPEESTLPRRDASNLVKLVAVLKENPGGLWIRELARQTKLHLETVRRLLRKYPFLFEEYADFTTYKINLKIIKLKSKDISADTASLEKYVKMAKKLGV